MGRNHAGRPVPFIRIQFMVWTIIVIDDTSDMTKSVPRRNHSILRLDFAGEFGFGVVRVAVPGRRFDECIAGRRSEDQV